MATQYYFNGPTVRHCSICGKVTAIWDKEYIEVPESTVEVDENGAYHYEEGYCSDCEKFTLTKKATKKVREKKGIIGKIVLVVLIIAVISGVGTLINKLVTGGGGQEWAYNAFLKQVEGNSALTAIEPENGAGTDTLAQFKNKLSEYDYRFAIYGENEAEIQKRTKLKKTSYYWVFKDGYGDLSNKTYILSEEILYEIGDENIAYYASAAEYSTLLEQLKVYFPENYCGKGQYNTEKYLDDKDEKTTTNVIYGDGVTSIYHVDLYVDGGQSVIKYYEKTDDVLLLCRLYRDGEGSSIAEIPSLSKCKEVK